MTDKQFNTFIDLFAGIGGFRIALESHGLNCVFSSEWDKDSQMTYQANFNEIPQGDITKIDEKLIPDHDIMCGGFPCQAFSISGKRDGFKDARGTLFFDIARIAKHKQPKVLFLENVKNFAQHDSGNTLKTVLSALDEIGYDVFYKVINAGEYGVPTARKRIYFVCFRKDLRIKKFEFPSGCHTPVFVKDIVEKGVDLSEFEIKRDDISIYAPDPEEPKMKPVQIGKINKGGQGERIYSAMGHAVTLSAYGGGAASKTGAYLIDGKVRKLTPRECARVMGFPDSFIIPVSKGKAYKQFGNSVAIPVLKKIAMEILNAK